jgi:glycosyltransferase involved in cell wall biosynthesis
MVPDCRSGGVRNTIVAVVPLYNGADFIEDCLASILKQTRQPDEIFVIDDGSTDDGAGTSIVRNFQMRDHRIRLLRKQNGGQGSARNFGVRASHSDLIAFLDQDDAWYSNHLEELIKPFAAGSAENLGWVYSNLDRTDANGNVVERSIHWTIPKCRHPKDSLISCLKHDMFILPSASLINRRAFEAVEGFDERLRGHEDDDLFLRIFCAGYQNIYVDAPLSQWRLNPDSTSFGPMMRKSRMIHFEKLLTQFPDDPKSQTYLVRDVIAPRFVRNTFLYLLSAVARKDTNQLPALREDIKTITPHLSLPQRILWWHIRMVLKMDSATAILPPTLSFYARVKRAYRAGRITPKNIIRWLRRKRVASDPREGIERFQIYDPAQVQATIQHRLSTATNELEKLYYSHQGRPIFKWHHYLEIYDRFFQAYREKPNLRILEIGVQNGGSLQLWRKYFGAGAKIFGIDIDPRCSAFSNDSTVIRIGDQADTRFLQSVLDEMGGVDIVIDDGSHVASHQEKTFRYLFPRLEMGGIYLCEDLHTSYWPSFEGGYRKNGTFIELSKQVVDEIHGWYWPIKTSLNDMNLTKKVRGISFFDSVVVIEKGQKEMPFCVLVGRQ